MLHLSVTLITLHPLHVLTYLSLLSHTLLTQNYKHTPEYLKS
jgi:hypothetical protein